MATTLVSASRFSIADVTGRRTTAYLALVGISSLVLAAGFASLQVDGWGRLIYSYFHNWVFCVSLCLGAIVFVALQHVTGSRWSASIRRMAEVAGIGVWPLAMLFLPIAAVVAFGNGVLYEWNDDAAVAADPVLQRKGAYLNAWFFLTRCAFYLTIWVVLARKLLALSSDQDLTGTPRKTELNRTSVITLILFGITLTFAAFDLLMSLDPHWFSSIYGVYFFSGCVVGGLCLITLIATTSKRLGFVQHEINQNHYHDLGKLLFGFTCFWAYIAFSQYLLIWYANIPEETGWYAVRQSDAWRKVSILLIVGHFALPFFGLLSRRSKRNAAILAGWAGFLLLMHWVDLYWLIMPEFSPTALPFSALDILCLTGMLALMIAGTFRLARQSRLLAVGDPYFAQSVQTDHA